MEKKGVTVQNASTSSGANVFQYDYTDNAGENDEWYLEQITTHVASTGNKEKLSTVIIPDVGITVYTIKYDYTENYVRINSAKIVSNNRNYGVTVYTSRRPDEIPTHLTVNARHVSPDDTTIRNINWLSQAAYIPGDALHYDYKVNTEDYIYNQSVNVFFYIQESQSGHLPLITITERLTLN